MGARGGRACEGGGEGRGRRQAQASTTVSTGGAGQASGAAVTEVTFSSSSFRTTVVSHVKGAIYMTSLPNATCARTYTGDTKAAALHSTPATPSLGTEAGCGQALRWVAHAPAWCGGVVGL